MDGYLYGFREILLMTGFERFSVSLFSNLFLSFQRFPSMQRHTSLTALITVVSASGVALYPVIASDLDEYDFIDPLDLVLAVAYGCRDARRGKKHTHR